MTTVDLRKAAAALPEAWTSRLLGRVGGAGVKVLRMDGRPLPPESHPTAEALLVLDGELRLTVGGRELALRPGEVQLVEAGVEHTVRPGSHGTLLLVEGGADGAEGT
ncbi:cupin domain-containing protein [Streptomyces sp. NPDC046887]|uniref:cupin domain-containing protein n=1 Tax=Streptomyces sp. NPDC046887 TaxID=3155472 RepID=UPI0033C21650